MDFLPTPPTYFWFWDEKYAPPQKKIWNHTATMLLSAVSHTARSKHKICKSKTNLIMSYICK